MDGEKMNMENIFGAQQEDAGQNPEHQEKSETFKKAEQAIDQALDGLHERL